MYRTRLKGGRSSGITKSSSTWFITHALNLISRVKQTFNSSQRLEQIECPTTAVAVILCGSIASSPEIIIIKKPLQMWHCRQRAPVTFQWQAAAVGGQVTAAAFAILPVVAVDQMLMTSSTMEDHLRQWSGAASMRAEVISDDKATNHYNRISPMISARARRIALAASRTRALRRANRIYLIRDLWSSRLSIWVKNHDLEIGACSSLPTHKYQDFVLLNYVLTRAGIHLLNAIKLFSLILLPTSLSTLTRLSMPFPFTFPLI